MRKAILASLCAAAVSITVVGCGGGGDGGGDGGTAGPSPEAYCQLFQQDWSTFQQARTVINDASGGDLVTPQQDSDRRELIANKDELDKAAGLASDLAKLAPTRLEEGYPWGTMTPRKMFEDMSTALVKAGQGTLSARNDAMPEDLFFREGTGCNFGPDSAGNPNLGGPDGTVARMMWQS